MKKTFQTAVVVAALAALTGCATIMGSPTQLIPISSTPSEATVVITDEKGAEMFKGATPTTVTLPKSNGSYWGKKSFTVKITKEGFQEQVIPVTASSPDGVEQRTIILAVERNTKVLGPVLRDSVSHAQ